MEGSNIIVTVAAVLAGATGDVAVNVLLLLLLLDVMAVGCWRFQRVYDAGGGKDDDDDDAG